MPSPALIAPLPVTRFLKKLAPNVRNNIPRNHPFACSFATFFICFFCVVSLMPAAVNPNCFKTLLAYGLSTFPIKVNPVFSNGPKSLPKNPPDIPILYN